MTVARAKEIVDEIYSDVICLEITNDRKQRLRIAMLVAKSHKKRSNDAIWQYVINEINERLSK
ncbi:hypothetical protein CLV58_12564 [Spirosoma oryzae]|uniref:Uncharacterized protein n=1 Tax=Spirosoma oryzae TaxID=1469603 RepID=A0A2T0S8S3_9BACT|nr:hypothetical protein CLV58_12564 [Spirosoma oryzae]